MSRASSPSYGKPYGLVRVCKAWSIPRSTYYQQRSTSDEPPKRPGPKGFHCDEELLRHIRQVISECGYCRHSAIQALWHEILSSCGD